MLGRRELILAVIAVCVVVFSLLVRPDIKQSDGGGSHYEFLTPGLKSSVNAVDNIRITQGSLVTTLKRMPDGSWIVVEKSNYPAAKDEIRTLLLFLSQSQLRDKKTDDPTRLRRLGLNNESASRVVIKVGETVLHDIFLGTADNNIASTYVKYGDSSQSYIASGVLDYSANPSDWLYYGLFSIDRKRVKSISYEFDGRRSYRYERNSPDEKMTLSPLPKDKKLKQPNKPSDASNYFERMKFVNVVADDNASFQQIGTVIMQTFDGIELIVDFKDVHYEQWASFRSDVRPSIRSENINGLKPLEEIREEVRDINKRVDGWLYKLGQFQYNQLSRSYYDLVELK